MGSLPNQFAVSIDRLDAMQRNGVDFAFVVDAFERTGTILGKFDFPKRHRYEGMLDAVIIGDAKIGAAELGVPAYAIEQFSNRNHG